MAKRALGPATWTMVRAIRSHCDPERPWLVACSGGRDSLSLAAAAAIARPGAVSVVVVDHQLQSGSGQVAERVRAQLAARGVPVDVVPVTVGDRGGPEAAARTTRHQVLVGRARDAGAELLLGHTRDDQAETVLLGLARGSGGRALSGMAPRQVWGGSGVVVVRPLIDLRRETGAAVCGELGLTWWDDPHNDDSRFARSRVRTQVMPALERELGPGIVDALARTARQLREDADHLDALAAEALVQVSAERPVEGPGADGAGVDGSAAGVAAVDLRTDGLSALPAPIRRRVLRDWLRVRGATDIGEVHIVAVDRLVTDWHGQAPVEVPGLAVERRHGRLHAL